MAMAADAAVARPEGGQTRTIAEARRALASALRASGIDSADLDARILVGHVLGLEHAALAAEGMRRLAAEEEKAIAAVTRRRLAREPVARIVGCKEFWSLPLRIDATTLVPRPETETVVEAALAAIDGTGERSRRLRIADLGTGSGALLVALLSELPNAFGVGTDCSIGALRIAHENALKFAPRRAAFVGCDMTSALHGAFDLIVSNPPYIASGAIGALAPEVRNFDPRTALDGGPDGLEFYRLMALSTPALLARAGALVVELGIGQSETVAELFAMAGLAVALPQTDLNDVPRALVVRRRA